MRGTHLSLAGGREVVESPLALCSVVKILSLPLSSGSSPSVSQHVAISSVKRSRLSTSTKEADQSGPYTITVSVCVCVVCVCVCVCVCEQSICMYVSMCLYLCECMCLQYIGCVLFSQTVHKDIYEMLLKIKESLEITKQYTDDQIKQAASQGWVGVLGVASQGWVVVLGAASQGWVVGLGVECGLSGVGCGAGCQVRLLRGGLWGWVSSVASQGWVVVHSTYIEFVLMFLIILYPGGTVATINKISLLIATRL